MIPFGPWHPDKAGINVAACVTAKNMLPVVNGFAPLGSLEASTGQIGSAVIVDNDGNIITDSNDYRIVSGIAASTPSTLCNGAAVVYDDDGDVFTFAGDDVGLYLLNELGEWDEISRVEVQIHTEDNDSALLTDSSGNIIITGASGASYQSGGGERWQFGFAGGLVIATTINEFPQKYLLGTSENFELLGGTPPRARYIATVRDFVVLGGLYGDERTIHWSGLANAEHWTPGAQSCDTQTFQNGGPVRGIVGGETGYIFQADKIQRMSYAPGSPAIFNFDEVEGGRGLAAPYSLVRLGTAAYYYATDGFYTFALGAAAATPIGVGKWAKWFADDIRPGTEQTIIGGIDPVSKVIVWGYTTRANPDETLDRIIIYNWALDEAVFADVEITTLAQILTQGVTLDTMDSYGTVDELAFSLDSPVWRGGAPLLGVFGQDNAMSHFNGEAMAAEIETNDGETQGRVLIKGVRPHINTRSVTVAVAAREADGDDVIYNADEAMADTGVNPAWASGFLARARVTIAAGATWSKITGITTDHGRMGRR